MLNSRKYFFLLFISFVTLTGCLRSAKTPSSSSEATKRVNDFRVQDITGGSIAAAESPTWKVPTEKKYEFSTCLIGRTTTAQLPGGQEFRILTPDNKVYMTKTDDFGCIDWVETIPFNFSGDSTYIELHRTLSGTKNYRGNVALKIGINPWAEYRGDNSDEVIDLNRNKIAGKNMIPEAATKGSLAGLFTSESGRQLLIESRPVLNVIPIRKVATGQIVKVMIQTRPYIEPLNLNQDVKKYAFTQGKFRVFAQIVSNYAGEGGTKSMVLTPELRAQEVEVTNDGLITYSMETKINRFTSNGQVQLALKIVPLGAPFEMVSYEGLHNVGTFNRLLGSNWVFQVQGNFTSEKFSFGDFLTKTTNFDVLKKAGFAHNLPPVFFSYLEPRFVRFASGETATRRKLNFRISTIVTDSITGNPIANQPFRIKRSYDNVEVVVPTDHRGVLRWMDEISHLYYKPEQYFFPKAIITHIESGLKEERTLAINPWDEGWTFGVDTTNQKAEYLEVSQREVRSPLFIIDAFRYQTIRFRYVIDEFLTLNVKKAVVMTFDPLVQRYGIKGDRYFEPLRDGIYLMKMALVKYYIDPFKNKTHLMKDPKTKEHVLTTVAEGGDSRKGKYTTVVKKLVRVQGGRITTPVEFSMRDLRMMSIRSTLLVQIETIDERKLLRDNIIDSKMQQLLKEYQEFNSADMSPEDKEKFLAEKEELFRQEQLKLKETMGRELKVLEKQRELVSDQYFKRFQVLSDLEDSLGTEVAKTSENYRRNLELPEEEFKKMLAKTHERLDLMESNMESYWKEWSEAWVSSLAEGQVDGLPAIPKENLAAETSYYDYLVSMQTFLKDFGIGATVGYTDLNKMRINNYTENPAAPFVDLDLYKEDSGLAPRTFIGPCTLVENDNMSDMRPTDTLDEDRSGRLDSSQQIYKPRYEIDNSAFEDSAYHDSLRPFKDKLVDEFIPLHIENEKKYEREMDVLSQMGNFTKTYNLEYVSLQDKPLMIYENGCKFVNGKTCLVEHKEDFTPKADFLTQINDVDFKELLVRYFYWNSMSSLKKANREIVDTGYNLQPLWDRTLDAASEFFDFLDFQPIYQRGKDGSGYDRARHTIYYQDAQEYIKEKLNDKIPALNEERLKSWLNKGVSGLKLVEAAQICQLISKQAIKTLSELKLTDPETKTWFRGITPEQYLIDSCLTHIKYMPLDDEVHLIGMTFDRRFRVIQPGPYEHVAGKNMNINVGADFAISSYQDIGTVNSIGGNGAALLGMVAAGIGKINPLLAGASVAAGLLIAQKTANEGEGVNDTFGTSVSEATFLVVQKAEMKFIIEKHEKCLVSQFTPEFINNLDFSYLGLKEGVRKSNPHVHRALGRGFVLCDGEVNTEPQEVMENYYYVTQHFTAGDMLDNANLLNHVWLLSLRGAPDYNNFIRILKARTLDKDGVVLKNASDLYEYPLSHLDKVYRRVTPTFPGMYSVPH